MAENLKDSVFRRFYSCDPLVRRLKETLYFMNTDHACFCLLKIDLCNAKYGVQFTRATCHTSRNTARTDSYRVAYPVSRLFKSGCEILQQYLDNPANLPTRKCEREALANLLTFLLEFEAIQNALKKAWSRKKTEWTIALAHHLFSRLTVNPTYFVDENLSGKVYRCPCCNEPIKGKYTDTSIGCMDVWHGSVGLILGADVPVVLCAADEEDIQERYNQSTVEDQNELITYKHQIIAQNIVYSFLQKKNHPEHEHCLIPAIGISKEDIVFYCYDSEKDILLESNVFHLFDKLKTEMLEHTIVAFWLAVNFKYTCSGVPPDMEDEGFRANLVKHVQEKIEIYETGLEFGCGSDALNEDIFDPLTVNELVLAEEHL